MKTLAGIAALASAGALLGLQIVGGLEAVAGGSLYTQASMIGAMVATAALPVFIHAAWHHGAKPIAIALFVGFVAFLAYSLPATVGRTGEVKHAKAAASVSNAIVEADLKATQTRLAWAMDDTGRECGSGAGPACRGKRQTVQALEARVEKLRADLRAAPAGDLGSEAWAWASAGLVSAETVRKASTLAFALGLEMSIWSLVWLATVLLGRTTQATVSAGVFRASDLVVPEGTTDEELEDLRKLLLEQGRPLTNDEVAALLSISKGESSKRVSKAVAAGLVERRREGREVQIVLH
jgi:hypothetical protein